MLADWRRFAWHGSRDTRCNRQNASTSLARQSDDATAFEVVIRALIRKAVLSREDLVQEFEKVQTANRQSPFNRIHCWSAILLIRHLARGLACLH